MVDGTKVLMWGFCGVKRRRVICHEAHSHQFLHGLDKAYKLFKEKLDLPVPPDSCSLDSLTSSEATSLGASAILLVHTLNKGDGR